MNRLTFYMHNTFVYGYGRNEGNEPCYWERIQIARDMAVWIGTNMMIRKGYFLILALYIGDKIMWLYRGLRGILLMHFFCSFLFPFYFFIRCSCWMTYWRIIFVWESVIFSFSSFSFFTLPLFDFPLSFYQNAHGHFSTFPLFHDRGYVQM